jgi:hypothetical protein
MAFEIQVLVWDRDKNIVGFYRLMGFLPSPLDKWISNTNTDISNQLKALQKFASTQ